MCVMSPSATEIEHRKIEPITKHLFPLQDKSIKLAKQNQISENKYKAIIIMYKGITSKISRPTPACIYYYYSTHRPLSNMHLVY